MPAEQELSHLLEGMVWLGLFLDIGLDRELEFDLGFELPPGLGWALRME
jgi:hypothetical protein